MSGGMSRFERYLSFWVLLCMAAGMALGRLWPAFFVHAAQWQWAQVNIPIALLIWAMIIPMLARIDFSALHQLRQHGRGMAATLLVNWGVKPFSMSILAVVFIQHVFVHLLPAQSQDDYVAGLILLAAAPCTAMVFVWSRLSGGDPLFTLSQVALNDLILVFAFAPLVAYLLGVSHLAVPWSTLLVSVFIYIVVPVVFAQLLRALSLAHSPSGFEQLMGAMGRMSMLALLAMLVLLFAYQGDAVLAQPAVIAMLAAPIIVQVFFNAGFAYLLNRALHEKYAIAAPSALIGASNFFELAVATAIALFGVHSGAALATVVGVLVEVPAMLVVVALLARWRSWYEKGLAR